MKKSLVVFFIAVWLSVIASVAGLPAETQRSTRLKNDRHTPVTRIPLPDGLFHVYALPVGQGDARIIQCPSGTINIFDLGTSNNVNDGFWFTNEIRNFLQGNFQLIKNVFLTHNHLDHYSFLANVLLPTDNLSGLTDIYVSCTFNEMVTNVQNWINNIGAAGKLRVFNGGATCGSSGGPSCGTINLCPNDPGVTTSVLSANAGLQCVTGNKNIDSVVIGIKYGTFSLQMNGDFEDFTTAQGETGPIKAMVDFYGPDLQVTVYMIAHHGAEVLANKQVILSALKPKAVFVSANSWYSNYRHPRCALTDYLVNTVGTLCKPLETNTGSPFYCGQHPRSDLGSADILQFEYTCGPTSGGLQTTYNNEFAIYSTLPYTDTLNLIDLMTNGNLWGFVNNYSPRIIRDELIDVETPANADECFEEEL